MTEPHTEPRDAPDRALRLRFDRDVRTEDEVGAGVARTGLPTPPARDVGLAIVLGTALTRAALAWLPGEFRRDAATDLASLRTCFRLAAGAVWLGFRVSSSAAVIPARALTSRDSQQEGRPRGPF